MIEPQNIRFAFSVGAIVTFFIIAVVLYIYRKDL